MDQDRGYAVQLVSTEGVCVTGASGGGFDDICDRPGFVSRRYGLRRGGREYVLPLVLRASWRVHGGPTFELDAGSGFGQTGAALASAGMARPSCAYSHFLEWVEDGLRAARLDRFRGIRYIESCVGGILKFFKETVLRRSLKGKDSLGVRAAVLLFRLLAERERPCSDCIVLNPTTPDSSLSSIGEGVLAVYGG